MRLRLAIGFSLALSISVHSQTVNVRGKVSNASGSAIANAIVSISRLKMKDTTGADGTYSLMATVGILSRSSAAMSSSIEMDHGVLQFYVSSPAPIKVDIFNMQGKLLDRKVFEKKSPGIYRMDLPGNLPAENLFLVKATLGNSTSIFKYFPMAKGDKGNNGHAGALENVNSASMSLAKIAATVDTLNVTATGFAAKSILLSTYDTTINVTLDSSKDKWGGLKNPAAPSAGCGKAAAIVNGKQTITSSGQSRSYTIDIPASYNMNKPYRFFYCSHWIGSSAEAVVGQNYYFLKPLANAAKDSAIFLAPQALPGNPNGTWATGANDSTDNVLFVDILKYVKANLCIDTTRVFATGFSFGGMMTYSLSVNRQNLIRAAVGIAPANYNIYVPPKNHQSIAWMQTTGMSDGTCPWINGTSTTQGSKYIALEHGTDNGCTLPAGNNIPTWTTGAHVCYDFLGCKTGYPTKACTFNGPHTNINSDPGSSANWIPDESWKFFTQF